MVELKEPICFQHIIPLICVCLYIYGFSNRYNKDIIKSFLSSESTLTLPLLQRDAFKPRHKLFLALSGLSIKKYTNKNIWKRIISKIKQPFLTYWQLGGNWYYPIKIFKNHKSRYATEVLKKCMPFALIKGQMTFHRGTKTTQWKRKVFSTNGWQSWISIWKIKWSFILQHTQKLTPNAIKT